MSFQYSVAVRNAKLDQIQTTIGTLAILKIFTGAEPANCAAADPAGLLVSMSLPSSWMATASGGSKTLAGTWSGAASASGIAASFRLYASDGVTCGIQGAIPADMTLDNTNIASGQIISTSTFTISAGNS